MRFSKKGPARRSADGAGAAASMLFAAAVAPEVSAAATKAPAVRPAATEITFLTGNGDTDVASAKAVIEAFQAANPGITVKTDTRPGGSEGDNLVKTRLATGDMADVFVYNNGSLLQAIKPAQNLHPLDDQPWAGQLDPLFAESSKGPTASSTAVRTGRRSAAGFSTTFRSTRSWVWRSRRPGTSSWPTTKRSRPTAAPPRSSRPTGRPGPPSCSYWVTSTMSRPRCPTFAADYTANKAKYATTPAALAGFENMQKVKEAGYFNKDFASAKLNDGIKAVATGTAAHYPMLGGAADGIETVAPGKSKDVGFFALPGNDAATNGMTVWPGTAAMYIPKTVEGDKLEAAKKFIAFAATQEGCDAVAEGSAPQGPFVSTACKLPADVSQVAKDTQAYFESGKASPALEFLSPIKGPALEQITVQVGTGQVTGKEGAELYDQDVKKQAQQLGLPGWE